MSWPTGGYRPSPWVGPIGQHSARYGRPAYRPTRIRYTGNVGPDGGIGLVSPGEPHVDLVPRASRKTSRDYPFEIWNFTYGSGMNSMYVVRLCCPTWNTGVDRQRGGGQRSVSSHGSVASAQVELVNDLMSHVPYLKSLANQFYSSEFGDKSSSLSSRIGEIRLRGI